MGPLAFIVPIFPVISWLAIVTGIYFFVWGLRLRVRAHRQIATASKTGSVSRGLVQVSGIATCPSTISAPITGEPCYLFRTTVWQQRKAANLEWEKVAEETLQAPFFLDDSTGRLLIEARGADLDLRNEFHKEYDPHLFSEQNQLPPPVSLFLARHEVNPARRIRVEECCIRPESVIFIVGTVMENPGIEIGPVSQGKVPSAQPSRVNAPEVIRLSLSSEPRASNELTLQAKIAAALVKAGAQPANAWDTVGSPSPTLASGGEAHESGEPLPNGRGKVQPADSPFDSELRPPFVLMKGPEGAPFLISWRSRRELARTPIWQSAALLCGGAILSLAGLYLLLLTMHLL